MQEHLQEVDYHRAMQYAVIYLRKSQRELSLAAWAAPETQDAIEHLRMSIDTLAKRIKREQERWEKERNEN